MPTPDLQQLLTTDMVEASDAPYLLEYHAPGLPLIISFGYYAADNNPRFDFYGRLKNVEQRSGRRLNKLLLRDSSQLWYLAGIPGLAQGVDDALAAIRACIAPLEPSHIVTIGQSMGAYAAILYGTLLGAQKTIAFGPLSCFDGALWQCMGDRRWQAQLDQLLARGVDFTPYHDLPPWLATNAARLPNIDLLYGIHPGAGALRHEAVGLDAAHAMRFHGLPGVATLAAPHSGHAIVEYFRSQGVMSNVLMHRLFNDPLAETIARLAGADAWVGWLEQNMAIGCSEPQLRETMAAQGMAADTISDVFARAQLVACLRVIETQPPSFTL